MAKKRFLGYSQDIQWHVPNRIRPIAYSTASASDTIKYVFVEAGYNTPNKIMDAIHRGIFLGGQEEEFVMQQFISKGHGDLVLNLA